MGADEFEESEEKRMPGPANTSGDSPSRNFRDVVAGMSNAEDGDRESALHVGDYIDILPASFNSWCGVGNIRNKLPEYANSVRVSITAMERDKYGHLLHITVQADGIEKKVHPSLFYNNGRSYPKGKSTN